MNTKTKYIVSGVLVAIVIFFGGYKVGEMKTNKVGQMAAVGMNGQFGGAASGVRNGMARGGAGMGTPGGFAGRAMANITAGEIISKDATSITIKLQDGGSRIVFVSTSTPVTKATAGSLSDLQKGINVTIQGTQNSDGSLTASGVQIRPVGMNISGQRASSTNTSAEIPAR